MNHREAAEVHALLYGLCSGASDADQDRAVLAARRLAVAAHSALSLGPLADQAAELVSTVIEAVDQCAATGTAIASLPPRYCTTNPVRGDLL